ncbi:hypothetical protein NNL26_12220 (plasmid) [Micrococcus luteus]|uniref:hypothetical protein n=1 Tax=Micrococcus luteus TaxID=1270 RepID=UPI0021065680|nr:hypothetical protein [Micrococcus luteus]UTX35878.1 hypothetical protein NNL26_12220 [Micrococcus luteus]
MPMDTTHFLEEMRRMNEERMAAAERIADALARREEAHAAAAEADSQTEAAFRDAERAGWTPSELNRLRPSDMTTRKRSTRTRRPRKTNSTSGTPEASPEVAPKATETAPTAH